MKLRLLFLIFIFLFSLDALGVQEVKKFPDTLYYYRWKLESSTESISKAVAAQLIKEIEQSNPRNLNYLGYHLLVNKNSNAIPVLIEFMNPKYKKENQQDANYYFTWTLLQMLIKDEFIILSSNEASWYKEYKKWWMEQADNYKVALDEDSLKPIFKKIKENEDVQYRANW